MAPEHIPPSECADNALGELLPDYLSGHLGSSDRARVEAHLEECEVCRASLAVAELLRKSDASTGIQPEDHPSDQLLIEYYRDKAALQREQVVQIEAHLQLCPHCRYEYDFLTGLEQDLKSAEARSEVVTTKRLPAFFRDVLLHPAFAYTLFAIALIPAIQWLSFSEPEIKPAPTPVLPTSAVRLLEMQRGAGEPVVVERKPGQAFLLIQAPYYALVGVKQYRFAFSHEGTDSLIFPTVVADFAEPGFVALLFASSELQDGRWQLHLFEIERANPSDTSFADFSFDLVTR